MNNDPISRLWALSQDDAKGMRLGYTTQQHYFAALVAAAEREACAKICDAINEKEGWYECGQAEEAAKQIRARGQQ